MYLVIDDISMILKSFFAVLSRHVGIGKAEHDISSHSFGGINLILCSDFHQFSPVVYAGYEVLYKPADAEHGSINLQLGQTIYEEFQTVVILREQVCVTDAVWQDFLTHLRYGQVQPHHLKMLHQQIVQHPDCPPTDFATSPWNDTSLVTP